MALKWQSDVLVSDADEKAKKQGVDIQVDIQTGYSFLENWIFKTLARATVRRYRKNPKSRVKYRKLTLLAQLSEMLSCGNARKQKGLRAFRVWV